MTKTKKDKLQFLTGAEQHVLELGALYLGYVSQIVFQNQSFSFPAVTADMENVGIVLEQQRTDVRDSESWFFLYFEVIRERRRLNGSVYRANFISSPWIA